MRSAIPATAFVVVGTALLPTSAAAAYPPGARTEQELTPTIGCNPQMRESLTSTGAESGGQSPTRSERYQASAQPVPTSVFAALHETKPAVQAETPGPSFGHPFPECHCGAYCRSDGSNCRKRRFFSYESIVAGAQSEWFRDWDASAEYIFWWTNGTTVAPLVTTSLQGPDPTIAGMLGRPETSILFGDRTLNTGSHPGHRFRLATMFDPSTRTSVEAVYTRMFDRDRDFVAGAASADIVARPFIDIVTDAQDARLIRYPGFVDGTLIIDAKSDVEYFQFNARRPLANGDHVILGYRYANFSDRLTFREITTSLSGPTLGSTFEVIDSFETENTFNGVDLGYAVKRQRGSRLFLDVTTKLGFGETRGDTSIGGQTTTKPPGGTPTTAGGGLLALPTNIGFFRREEFTVITEVNATVRYCIARGVHATLGYTFVFWPEILRAANQVDTAINPTQIPPDTLSGDPRPVFRAAESDLWMQGIRLGVECCF